MTIHRDWIGVMKEECPAAFTKDIPFKPKVAFIDGMPLLMKSSHITRWSELVNFNFARPVKRFMGLGASVVVLGFDVYTFVPGAKSITQANRSKRVAKCSFSDQTQLPTVIPLEYNDFMRNRAFKRRVVQLVVETLPGILDLKGGQELIIDYESCPIRFRYDVAEQKVVQDFMVDIPPMGECDVKCTRWFKRYGDGVAHSVDGDFIPISLINYEAELRNLQANPDSRAARPNKVAIFRMEFGANKDDNDMPESLSKTSKKRSLTGSERQQTVQKAKKTSRPMEYVSIPLLYESMFIAFRQLAGTGFNSR